MNAPHRIDTHHHIFPTRYMEKERERVLGVAHRLAPQILGWTPAAAVEGLDRAGIATAVTSISAPGVWFGDARAARGLSRDCNEYAARMALDHKGRFGVFAALPLPDVDGSLAEIEHAFDELRADGVGLMTSYGDAWLGNPAYRPVMEELNRRKAIVHVHPTAANCCRNLDYAPGVNPGSMEYGTDTTRAIMGVTFSGDAARFPDIRFIWSHAGGTAPFLAGRIDGASAGAKDRLPNGFMTELKKFYYDLAGAANPGAVASLLKLVTTQQILFGTDFPPGGTGLDVANTLVKLGVFSESDLRSIDRENAVRLLPRFKA